MSYEAFVQAAVNTQHLGRWRQHRRAREARFGQDDLSKYMAAVNADMEAFDAWTVDDQKPGGKANLGQSFWGAWTSFMNDPRGTDSQGRPTGWRDFFKTTFAGTPEGQTNPALRASVNEYKARLAHFNDEARAAGGTPPELPTLTPPDLPTPPIPPPHVPPPQPSPNGTSPKPNGTNNTKKAGAGIGVLFLLGGVALVIASRQK